MATNRRIISSPNVKEFGLPFSQAVQVDKTLYISGQVGLNLDGHLIDGVKGQTKQILDNIGHLLHEVGGSHKNLVKVQILLKDLADFADVNSVYAEYFKDRFPARMTYQVSGLPLPGALVEIDAVAIIGDINEL